MSRELPPPTRDLRARAVQPLREALEALGIPTLGRRDEELIILAARELRAVKWARDDRARRDAQQAEAHRLRHFALPGSVREAWALGAAVDVYELVTEAPYFRRRGQGVISERRVQGTEVVSVRISTRGHSGETLTRRPGSSCAWGNTGSLIFVAPLGTELSSLPPQQGGKLKIFSWTAEEAVARPGGPRDTSRRVQVRHLAACPSLRELNVLLRRTRNEWPHVGETSTPGPDAWVLDHPLILFRSAPFENPVPPATLTYAPAPLAEAGRAWVLLRRAYGG